MTDQIGHTTLLTRAVMSDPYPTYARLRTESPVYYDTQLNGWVITRYDDVTTALRDHETYSSRRMGLLVAQRGGADPSPAVARLLELAGHWMWMLDPPTHTRMRKLMNQGFTPRAVRLLEPMVQKIVDDLVDAAIEREEVDLMADFCFPVPALVICGLYGLPPADARLVTEWCDALKVFLGASADLGGVQTAAEAVREMIDYLTEIMDQRRVDPRDDLVSRLVAADDAGDQLGTDELVSNLLLLIAASFETTIDMLGNGLAGLLTQRDQWELLKRDPSTIAGAVDEVIRWDGPVQLTHRLLTRDVELRGEQLREGQLVYLMRGSANRDPERFADPDRIDVTRGDTGHVGLGLGVHFCIGAGLSRMEGRIALTELTTRIPDLALVEPDRLTWRADNLQFRGLSELRASTS
ncbi:cytochrome P450 hydroxylase [Actinokineospora globicatena]|uniref:Cytochrome P450 hydroxylase n=2 Tax=Actinokineospora globicatena TaxID=103729 RepID=A0A9W6V4U2_9PSEU|nr:cytochrome P450 hydroxylase [Actinokineospora globicatena]